MESKVLEMTMARSLKSRTRTTALAQKNGRWAEQSAVVIGARISYLISWIKSTGTNTYVSYHTTTVTGLNSLR